MPTVRPGLLSAKATLYCRLRFKLIRRNRRKSNTATLTFEEILDARILYLRHFQDEFQADYKRLLNQQDLRHKSKLRTLSPQIDKHGLLRVGGRLGNSEMPADVQHPIILPKSHRITNLILEHEHRIHLYLDVSVLFVIARQRYWVFGARNLIRKITHDCLKCFKQLQHTSCKPWLRLHRANHPQGPQGTKCTQGKRLHLSVRMPSHFCLAFGIGYRSYNRHILGGTLTIHILPRKILANA